MEITEPRTMRLRSAAGAKRAGAAQYLGFIEPCHPAERNRRPTGGNWIHEIKADGCPAQVNVREGKVTVYSRRGHDWTGTFASIARAAESLPVRHAVLDGEAIVQDARGIADYHALRCELARKRSGNLTYYVFDLLYLTGTRLTRLSLSALRMPVCVGESSPCTLVALECGCSDALQRAGPE